MKETTVDSAMILNKDSGENFSVKMQTVTTVVVCFNYLLLVEEFLRNISIFTVALVTIVFELTC